MKAETVSDYIEAQVKRVSDTRVAPVVDAIKVECQRKLDNDSRKADLDKDSAECDKRIAELNRKLVQETKFVDAFRQSLTDSTNQAVS